MSVVTIEGRITDGGVVWDRFSQIWERIKGRALQLGARVELTATQNALRLAQDPFFDPSLLTFEEVMEDQELGHHEAA